MIEVETWSDFTFQEARILVHSRRCNCWFTKYYTLTWTSHTVDRWPCINL